MFPLHSTDHAAVRMSVPPETVMAEHEKITVAPHRLFKVFVYREDEGRIEGKRSFVDPVQADGYFKNLCTVRTESPSLVIGMSGREMKKCFRLGSTDHSNGTKLDLDWTSTDRISAMSAGCSVRSHHVSPRADRDRRKRDR